MKLPQFLERAVSLGCKIEESLHRGVFRVVVNDQEKFIVGDMRNDASYQLTLPGNSLPTRGEYMSYEKALSQIKESYDG